VEPGPRGIRLAPAPAPDGLAQAPGPPLRPVRGAPVPAHEVAIAAGGALAVLAAPGVARSLRVADLAVAFDRRPPGLSRVGGAALANAGLLLADDGWRAVVLPSLGDLVAGLGPGPVALRADGRRVATLRDGVIEEIDLPGPVEAGRHEVAEAPGALAYAADGRLLVAHGAAVGAPPTAGGEGSPVVALAAAAAAPRALARHADGSCSLWDVGGGTRLASWSAPMAGPLAMSLSADGALAALATPFATPAAACVVRADDGALVHHMAEARAVALLPSGAGLLVAGDWGTMWLAPSEEGG
jgi:hypothetical protein